MKAGLKRWFGQFPDLGDVVKRFPAAVMAMAVFTLIIIFKDVFPNDTQMGRLLAGLVIGAYLCVSFVLAAESRGRPPNLAAQLVMVFAAALLAWFSEALRLNLFMAVGAAVLLLGNAVIWRQKRDDLHVWDFTHKLWTGAVFAVVGSVIFTLGVLAIQETLRSLFGLNIRDLVSDFLLPIGLGFLAPLYWMATLPAVDEDYSELYKTPGFVSKAVAFLGTWLLSPLALIYALILLAYGVKILMSGELPKGEIATMTTPFLLVGTLTWLVLDPPFAQAKALARVFRKLWWPVSIPAALLLAVAVFVRIREYGYTPERFFLSLVVAWAVLQSLWFIAMPKAKRDIRTPTALAAVLLALGAFVAQPISAMNQFQRAQAVQTELPEFDAAALRERPKLAKQFLGSLKFLIRQQDAARFERLLPDRDMPATAYGPDYKALINSLGLDEVQENGYKRRVNFTVSTEQPITLSGEHQVYTESSLNLYDHTKVKSPKGIIQSQNGRNVVLSLDGDIYRLNFDILLSDIKLIGQNDLAVDTVIPLMSIESTSGRSAELAVLGGTLSYEGETLTGGNISIAVIVPN